MVLRFYKISGQFSKLGSPVWVPNVLRHPYSRMLPLEPLRTKIIGAWINSYISPPLQALNEYNYIVLYRTNARHNPVRTIEACLSTQKAHIPVLRNVPCEGS